MIAHKVKVVLGVALAICIVMAIPSFASPSLEDASVTYSVKVYYSTYVFLPTYTSGIQVFSDGSIDSAPDTYYTSDYISVTPGGTIGLVSGTSFVASLSCCFYDSSFNVVSGGTNTSFYYFSVPSGASYVRFTQSRYFRASILSAPSAITSLNDHYIWSEVSDITYFDGHITIPYQVNAYSSVFIDFEFYSNNSFIDSFSLDVYTYFTGGFFDGRLINQYIDENSLTLYRYYNSGNDVMYTYLDESVSNPSSLSSSFSESVEFRGFRLYIPVSYNGNVGSVSTSLHVDLSNFMLNGLDAQARSDVDSALNQLYDLGQAIAVPSPDLNTLLDVGGVLNNQNDLNASLIMSTIASDGGLITTMMVISVSLTVLGYILFGKKEA